MASITVHLEAVSPFTTEAKIRTHRVKVDRPEAKGGTDQGPMGGELFLAAVGGCFMSNLLAAIRARESDLGGIHAEVEGTLGEAPARFTSLELRVSAQHGDLEVLSKLVEIADRGCIMLNTLRGHVEFHIRIAVAA